MGRKIENVMQQAVMAARLVGGVGRSRFESLWCETAYGDTRRMYEAIASGEGSLVEEFRSQHPEFNEAYLAIFGDALTTPSYQHFRRLVNIGSNETLLNRANWDKLPDSVVALYHLSFIWSQRLQRLLNEECVAKTTTMLEASALRKQQEHEQEEESRQHGILLWEMADAAKMRRAFERDPVGVRSRIEDQCREHVRGEVIRHLLDTLPDEIKQKIEERVQRMVAKEIERLQQRITSTQMP